MKDILTFRRFERAFKSHQEGSDLRPFMDGMKMIFTKLDNVLHKHGSKYTAKQGRSSTRSCTMP